MKRICLFLLASAAVAVAGYLSTGLQAQAPAGGTPAAAPVARGSVAVFNVARVMRDFQRWQYYAAKMNDEKVAQSGELAKIRQTVVDLEGKYKVETIEAKKRELEQTMVALQRQFDDKDREIRRVIDDKSAKHLQELFSQIKTVVEKVAEVNGFQLVMAYPDAMTDEEMKSPVYYDMKLRPGAAMPFYVSPSVDITKVVVMTLNSNFPSPGPVPASVTPAAGTTPPAPMK